MDKSIPILKKENHKVMEFTGNRHEVKVVYFAVATTGFVGQDGQICEIAATSVHDGRETPWRVYVCPDNQFVPQASQYNGYTKAVDCHGKTSLIKDGAKVETCTLLQAIQSFVQYISHIAGSGHATVLVAWNSQQFHVPIFLKELERCKLTPNALEDAGVCYADPLLLVKKNSPRFPQIAQLSSRRLPAIYKHLNPPQVYPSFDACSIVKMLKSVMSILNVTDEQLKSYSFTISSADSVRKYGRIVKGNLHSPGDKLYTRCRSDQIVGRRRIISKSVAMKIAKSGLNFRKLRRMYHKHGQEGLERILKARLPRSDGSRVKPHVTQNKKVIDAIVQYFEARATHLHRRKTNVN